MAELHFTGKGSQDNEASVLNDEGQVVARFYGSDARNHARWEVRRRDGTFGRLMLTSCWLIGAGSLLFLDGLHYAKNEAVVIPTFFTTVLLAMAVLFFGHHCYLAGRRKELAAQPIQPFLPSAIMSESHARSSTS